MSVPLGNFINTTTRDHFFPTVVDNFYAGNRLWEKLRANARPWPGGKKIQQSITIEGRDSGGSYSGFDNFITTQEDVRIQLSENPVQYYWNLTLNGIQLSVNKGAEAFVNLIAEEFTDVSRAMKDKMGSDLYLDGTLNDSKAILGLVAHIDDATSVATYEGQSRATYPKLNATRTAQVGAIGFADLATDHDAAQVGDDHPTIAVTTPAVFSLIEALATFVFNTNVGQKFANTPAGAGMGGAVASAGISEFQYRGVPIISDEKCPAGNLWWLNENHLYLYTLDHSPELTQGSKEGFAWTGWKKSQNQDAIVGQILWAGQLFGDSPRTMARRTAITT